MGKYCGTVVPLDQFILQPTLFHSLWWIFHTVHNLEPGHKIRSFKKFFHSSAPSLYMHVVSKCRAREVKFRRLQAWALLAHSVSYPVFPQIPTKFPRKILDQHLDEIIKRLQIFFIQGLLKEENKICEAYI